MEATVAAIEPGRLAGTAAVPPSKARHTALWCARPWPPVPATLAMWNFRRIFWPRWGCPAAGAKVERGEHELTITGRGNADGFATITRPVFCNESGSTLRFILPLFSLTAQKCALPAQAA